MTELLALGMFAFGVNRLAYDELQRRQDWRHATSDRFGARPAAQYVGPGTDTITLTGMLVPEMAGSYSSIERLREMADTGDDWPLVDGLGKVWGNFRIAALDETHGAIMGGHLPRRIDFTVTLDRAS